MAENLIAALATYIPRDRAAEVLGGAPLAAEGAAMIADISGFTPLTEALARALSPARGAEELTRALNGVFAPLIAEASARGGSVVKFGGDALIVWFPRAAGGRRAAVLRRALGAALAMQAAIGRHGRVRTDAGEFTLTMKVGLAYGPALRTRLGDPDRGFEDVIGGRTLDRMAEAEHHASPGEVLLDPAGLPELAALAELGATRDGFVVVTGLRGDDGRLRPAPLPLGGGAAAVEALRPYVPAEVFAALRDGRPQPAELRPVVSIFVQFAGVSYEGGAAAVPLLARYFAAAQAAAARYGGRVNRLITGDKGSVLHLIFGAPRALEDLERRAALCALELRRAAAGLPFITAQRVGMVVGRAFAGPVGAESRRDYTVMGDAINRSARLMQRAEPGQIVVDGQLAERLRGGFALAPLGAARLKGVAEPVELFDLAGEAARPARAAEAPLGRGAELETLRGLLGRLRGGAGGSAVLIGELGMGKSHLLAALRAEAGAAWGSGSGAGYGPRPSGVVVAGALRELLGLHGEPEAAAARLGPALAALLGARRGAEAEPYAARLLGLPLAERQARELEALGGEGLRWRLAGLVRELAEAAMARGPVALAFDDVQWADPTSLELLEALLPAAAAGPLLLLLAARPEAAGRARALLERAAAAGAPALTLGPLDAGAAAELVRRHAPALAPDDAARLAARGAGNPLFLVELARTAAAGAPLDELPDTVQGLVLAQVDRLPAPEREALQAAAVLGAGATPPLVAELLGGGRGPAGGELEALEAAGFLARDGEGYAFRHGLIRESAYAALLHERRRALHGVAAAALERLYPARLADLAGALALHHEGAGDLLRAAQSHGQAADGARLLYANEEAEAGYRRALELLDAAGAPSDELRARTYLKLAQVEMNQGDYAAAQELYDRAFALLERAEEAGRARGRSSPTFRMSAEEPESLDPGLAASIQAVELAANLFEGLVEYDADLNIVPAAARRWEVRDAGLRYYFELRPGLRWSDGAPLTAHDFAFAWRRNLDPATGSPLAQQLYSIRGAAAYHAGEASDPGGLGLVVHSDLAFEVELERPGAPLLPYLCGPVASPQPAHQIERYGADWCDPSRLVVNGPYEVTHWDRGREIGLRRNRLHRRAARVERVAITFGAPTEDWSRREHLDWCRMVDEPGEGGFDAAVISLQYLATYFLVFACAQPPFDRPEVRRALGMCVDRERLVDEVWGGVQRPAMGGVVPPGIPGHSPGIALPFDPAAARQIVRRAGLRLPEFTLASVGDFRSTGAFLAESWREHLGVDARVVAGLDPEGALARLGAGEVQAMLIGWDLDSPDPARVLEDLFLSGSPLNFWGWRSERFDTLLAGGSGAAAYHEADRLLINEAAVVPLYYLRGFALLRPPFRVGAGERIIRGGRLKLQQIAPATL